MTKTRNRELTVQAKDTIDVSEYVLVHKTFLAAMRREISRFHKDGCICVYCKPDPTDEHHG